MDEQFIVECILHARDEREGFLPVRRMYGPYPSFVEAIGSVPAFIAEYETVLIHKLEGERQVRVAQ